MPEGGSDTSLFTEYCSRVTTWLQSHYGEVLELPNDECANLGADVAKGWWVTVTESSQEFRLKVFVDTSFPYSSIMVAYPDDSLNLVWPHVEAKGRLCLPAPTWSVFTDAPDALGNTVDEAIYKAIQLSKHCQDPEYCQSEFQKEFVSYWWRFSGDETAILRLFLKNAEHEGRLVAKFTHYGFGCFSDSTFALNKFWESLNFNDEGSRTLKGVLQRLTSPPVFPLPACDDSEEIYARFIAPYKHVVNFVGGLKLSESGFIVFSAPSKAGLGYVALELRPVDEKKAHTPGDRRSMRRRLGTCRYLTVERLDSSWIHGRDIDASLDRLSKATIVLLGVGAVGSQVANRLAQCGVGSIHLVDPDLLEAANIGRHAAGVYGVGSFKVKVMAHKLSKSYPHSSFEGHPKCSDYIWHSGVLDKADLILSCIGDSAVESHIYDQYMESDLDIPLVFGWVGTMGCTAHALALDKDSKSFSCVFNEQGTLRDGDCDFGNDKRQYEPACGTYFHPYGPLTVVPAELLISRLVTDILTGKQGGPAHRVHVCSVNDLAEAGGGMTDGQKRRRPEGYSGPFEYEAAPFRCGVCMNCMADVLE